MSIPLQWWGPDCTPQTPTSVPAKPNEAPSPSPGSCTPLMAADGHRRQLDSECLKLTAARIRTLAAGHPAIFRLNERPEVLRPASRRVCLIKRAIRPTSHGPRNLSANPYAVCGCRHLTVGASSLAGYAGPAQSPRRTGLSTTRLLGR